MPEGKFGLTDCLRFFENKKLRYLWNDNLQLFERVRGLDKSVPCSLFYEQKGLTKEQQNERLE